MIHTFRRAAFAALSSLAFIHCSIPNDPPSSPPDPVIWPSPLDAAVPPAADAATEAAAPPRCGNGVVEAGEQCEGRAAQLLALCDRVECTQACEAATCRWAPTCSTGGVLPIREFRIGGDDPRLGDGPRLALPVARYRAWFRATANAGSITATVIDATTGAILAGPMNRGSGFDFGGRHGDVSVELTFAVPPGAGCHEVLLHLRRQNEFNGGVDVQEIELLRDTHYTP